MEQNQSQVVEPNEVTREQSWDQNKQKEKNVERNQAKGKNVERNQGKG